MDISQLINVTDPKDKNKSIIEIDNYISELCNYGENIDILTDQQKNFFFNQELEREINNGGFHQYFFNLGGGFAHETVESLKNIQAHKTADILQKAINLFPNKLVPKNQTERQDILKNLDRSTIEMFRKLDRDFYKYEDNLNTLNLQYIRQNIDGFLVEG